MTPTRTEHLLYRLEQTAIASTTVAFAVTLLLTFTTHAQEANPVTAWGISTAGWGVAGLVGILGVVAAFAVYRRLARSRPRLALAGAITLTLVCAADAAWNLTLLGGFGGLKSVYWGGYGASVALVVGVAAMACLRPRLPTVTEARQYALDGARVADRAYRAVPGKRRVGAVVVVLLVVVGMQLAPVVLLETDHSGIAVASSHDNWTSEGSYSPAYGDGNALLVLGDYVYVADENSDRQFVRKLDKEDMSYTGEQFNAHDQPNTGNYARQMTTDGTYIYISTRGSRLHKFDPETMTNEAETDIGGGQIAYDNGYIYETKDDGLRVFDASDLSKVRVDDTLFASSAQHLTVGPSGDIYVQTASSLWKVSPDFSTKKEFDNPAEVGGGSRLDAGPNYLYVVNSSDDLKKIDYSLTTVEAQFAPSTARSLSGAYYAPDGYVYTAYEEGSYNWDTHRLDPETMASQSSKSAGYEEFQFDDEGNLYAHKSDDFVKTNPDAKPPAEQLSGNVTDGNGNPAPNVTVTATNTSTDTVEGSATTNSSGSYSLSVPAGDYDIEAGASEYKNETKTETVPSGGLTVDFQLRKLGDVNGYVVDQNGNPVEGATVYATGYDTASPPSIDGRSVDDIFNNPYPQEYEDQMDNNSGFNPEQSSSWDIDDSSIDAGPRVLMHTQADWDTESYPDELVYGVDNPIEGPPPENIQARTVVAPGTVHFACWGPPSAEVFTGSDPVDASLPGLYTSDECDQITIEMVDATGDTLNKRSVDVSPLYNVIDANNFGPPHFGSKTHEVATADLESGVYRVYPDDRVEDSMMYAVAPKGDIDNLEPRVDNANDSDLETKSTLNEEIKQLESNGNLEVESTTTDASGYYAISFENPSAVDSAELAAVKAGGDLSSVNNDLELSRQDLISESESAVKENFRNAEGAASKNPSEFLDDADNSRADFRDICSQMDPVADDIGVPFSGRTQTEVPSNDTEIRGYRATPPGLDSVLSECMAASLAQSLLENGLGFLDSGLLDDVSELSESELQARLEKIMPLLQANDDLRAAVEDATGVDIGSSNPSDYSREELEDISSGTTEELDEAAGTDGNGALGNQTDEDLNGGTGDGDDGVFGGGGGGGYNPPSGDSLIDDPVNVDSGEGNITENDTDVPDGRTANDTLNWKFVVDNVDNWDQTQVLIQLHYSDGTTDLLTKQDSHVDIAERTGRSDWVFIREYPVPEQSNSVEAEIDVVTPNGVDGASGDPAKSPSFNGEIPSLRSMKLSTLEPRPGQNVTLSVTPERGTSFGGLKQVNVTYPNGTTTSVDATADDNAYLTMADEVGTHRLEVVLLASDNETEFVETKRLRTVNAKAGRPPTIRATSGPTGTYALVSDGLERGTVNVADNRSHVEVIAVASEDGDPPSQVNAYVNAMNVNSDLTTTVKVRQGTTESNVRRSVGVRIYGPQRSSDAIYYRDGEPIPAGGENEFGSVKHENSSTIIDTYTDGSGEVTVDSIEDPGLLTRVRHYIGLRAPDLPFLSVVFKPLTAGLPSPSPSSSGSLPAPIQALVSFSMLASGIVAALREVGL